MAAQDGTLTDHMIAGSLSGIVEHASVFPIDTVKTHIQASAEGSAATRSALGVTRSLVRQHGVVHLYRGISALLPAIGPAHALMFSGYEQVLHLGGAREAGASAERVAVVGAVAGVVSTILHDSVMVPAETVKQRMQLGYYRNALHCAQAMLASGGGSFYRSLPTTLAMNAPYCSLMMMSNESPPARSEEAPGTRSARGRRRRLWGYRRSFANGRPNCCRPNCCRLLRTYIYIHTHTHTHTHAHTHTRAQTHTHTQA